MYLNATLLAQITVFIILALFTMKFVWPPIVKALDERVAKIAEGLAQAERGQQSLTLSAKRAAETVREGKEKAAEVIAQAEKRAEQIIEQARANAQVEAEKVKAAARAELEQDEARLRESLRGRVADLAVAGAEKILRREVNAKAHADLLAAIGQYL
ncbi:MAG: F0F1 ATP synthase subunit B [Candidatus Accumulibacter sp.]|nr:F0F1 ATP synthase subunit B [Accumulibacter sp.]